MDLSHEKFNDLLTWLDDDRDRAGEVYTHIHDQLSAAFRRWGCQNAEEMADETISRVAQKVATIAPSYAGDKIKYFYGTARYVLLERQRVKPTLDLPHENFLVAPEPVEIDPKLDCLEHCLAQITDHSRKLIVRFYRGEKGVKIENRRNLAEEMQVTVAHLRLQAHRIRSALKKCMLECLATAQA